MSAPAQVRMKPHEQEQLDKIAKKINRIRLDTDKKVMRDSTILHELLDLALDAAHIDRDGNLYLKPSVDKNLELGSSYSSMLRGSP